jgi:hypothetical protein
MNEETVDLSGYGALIVVAAVYLIRRRLCMIPVAAVRKVYKTRVCKGWYR